MIVAAYVRRMEGAGRPAVPLHIARWIDELARTEKVVTVALGIWASVGSYLTGVAVLAALVFLLLPPPSAWAEAG